MSNPSTNKEMCTCIRWNSSSDSACAIFTTAKHCWTEYKRSLSAITVLSALYQQIMCHSDKMKKVKAADFGCRPSKRFGLLTETPPCVMFASVL